MQAIASSPSNHEVARAPTNKWLVTVSISFGTLMGAIDASIVNVALPHLQGVFSLLPPNNATGNFVKVVQRVPVRIVFTQLPSNIESRSGLSADVTVYLH